MENTISLGDNLTPKQAQAVELHYEIIAKGNLAASAMVDFAKGLKEMRDKKMYLELNFNSFEEYAEQAVGLKQSQAYTYIRALESFGESGLQSNANLGITKLGILAALPWHEREDVLENNDVESMTTRELKEAIDKLHETQEQLSFMTTERDRLQGQIELAEIGEKTVEQLRDELDGQRDLIASLRSELKAAKEKPAVSSVREPSAEEIKALTKEAVEKEKQKAEKAKQKAVAEAEKAAREDERKKAAAEIEKKYKDAMQSADREKSAALARMAEMEKQAKLTSSPEVLKFSFYFDEAQKNINNMHDIISQSDSDTAAKLENAMAALAAKLQEG